MKLRFAEYAALSTMATTGVVGYAYLTRVQFYPAVIYLVTSKPSIMILLNQALVLTILIGMTLTRLFLGKLRESEKEIVHENLRYSFTEMCLALSTFREEMSYSIVVMFTALLFTKIFHWLAETREEHMEQAQDMPRSAHTRMVLLLICLILVNVASASVSLSIVEQYGPSVHIYFGFEYAILAIKVVEVSVKYILSAIDTNLIEGQWYNKSIYQLYLKLVIDVLQLAVNVLFFAAIFAYYGMPVHLTRQLYVAVKNVIERFQHFFRFRRITANLHDRFPDATEEDLAATDRVCIICREELVANSGLGAPKKLVPCGHIFHFFCLRNWLERQLRCPTCRAEISSTAPVVETPGLNAGAERAAPIEAGAAGGDVRERQQQQQQDPLAARRAPDDGNNNNNNNNVARAEQNPRIDVDGAPDLPFPRHPQPNLAGGWLNADHGRIQLPQAAPRQPPRVEPRSSEQEMREGNDRNHGLGSDGSSTHESNSMRQPGRLVGEQEGRAAGVHRPEGVGFTPFPTMPPQFGFPLGAPDNNALPVAKYIQSQIEILQLQLQVYQAQVDAAQATREAALATIRAQRFHQQQTSEATQRSPGVPSNASRQPAPSEGEAQEPSSRSSSPAHALTPAPAPAPAPAPIFDSETIERVPSPSSIRRNDAAKSSQTAQADTVSSNHSSSEGEGASATELHAQRQVLLAAEPDVSTLRQEEEGEDSNAKEKGDLTGDENGEESGTLSSMATLRQRAAAAAALRRAEILRTARDQADQST
mmetsp:Transcript_14404/g.26694  ORF Transcript_14404/g.26694 Transcript_14404/m.26694 type:complete len:762 (+) Transcript_14404:191-2476(+)